MDASGARSDSLLSKQNVLAVLNHIKNRYPSSVSTPAKKETVVNRIVEAISSVSSRHASQLSNGTIDRSHVLKQALQLVLNAAAPSGKAQGRHVRISERPQMARTRSADSALQQPRETFGSYAPVPRSSNHQDLDFNTLGLGARSQDTGDIDERLKRFMETRTMEVPGATRAPAAAGPPPPVAVGKAAKNQELRQQAQTSVDEVLGFDRLPSDAGYPVDHAPDDPLPTVDETIPLEQRLQQIEQERSRQEADAKRTQENAAPIPEDATSTAPAPVQERVPSPVEIDVPETQPTIVSTKQPIAQTKPTIVTVHTKPTVGTVNAKRPPVSSKTPVRVQIQDDVLRQVVENQQAMQSTLQQLQSMMGMERHSSNEEALQISQLRSMNHQLQQKLTNLQKELGEQTYLQAKIQQIETMKLETIHEIERLKEQSDLIEHQLQQHRDAEQHINKLVQDNRSSLATSVSRFIFDNETRIELTPHLSNVTAVEVLNQDLPDRMPTVCIHNDRLSFMQDDDAKEVAIPHGYYDSASLETALQETLNPHDITVKVDDNGIFSFASEQPFSLVFGDNTILHVMGFTVLQNLTGETNYRGATPCNLRPEKVVSIFLQGVSDPLTRFMLGSPSDARRGIAKVSLAKPIERLDALQLQFRVGRSQRPTEPDEPFALELMLHHGLYVPPALAVDQP